MAQALPLHSPTALRPPTAPWIPAVLFLVFASAAAWGMALNNDISWQYWVARQVRGGAVLYRDIVEVNPPLWFWEALPISALAERLGIDARHLAIVAVMARATLALVLVGRLLEDRPGRLLRLAGLAVLLCAMPLHDFGEREHLMLIGSVPYATLVARRRVGGAVPPGVAVPVGLLAAAGFCLKPHFALVPLALEIWLATGPRERWRPVRAETLCLGIVAALYALAILRFAPDYIRSTLPLARLAYGAFSPPLADLFAGRPWMPAWILGSVAPVIMRRTLPGEALAAAIAAAAAAAIYLLQGKGFPYHALPVSGLLGWALWLAIAHDGGRIATFARHPVAILALGLLAAGVCAMGPFVPIRAGRATAALERMPPGSTVAVVSAHSWLAFPLVEDRRFVWPVRNIGLWTIPMIAHDGASPAGQAVRRTTLDWIATDLGCLPPDAILVDDPARSPALTATGFDYEAFLRSDARIAALLAHYRPILHADGTTLYRPVARLAPSGRGCRPIAVRPDLP